MVKVLLAAVAALGVAAAFPAVAGPVSAASGAPSKMPEGSGKVMQKNGYWVECDNVGENCHYVMMYTNMMPNGDPAPGAKRMRVKAAAKVQVKDGYWVECDNVGENCHYVYAASPN